MLTIIATIVALALFDLALANEALPRSPCPNIFSYGKKSTNEVYGVVTAKNDLSGIYNLEVTVTLPGYGFQNMNIKLHSPQEKIQNGADLVYHLLFSSPTPLPRIAKVVLNNKVICSVSAQGNQGITISAYYNLNLPIFPGATDNRVTESFDTSDDLIQYVTNNHTQPEMSSKKPMSPTKSHTDFENVQNSLDQVSTTTPKVIVTSPRKRIITTSAPSTFNLNPVTIKTTKSSTIPPSRRTYSRPRFTTTATSTTSTTTAPVLAHRIFEDICGMSDDTQALLVQGSPTTENQHPWLIAMFHLGEKSAGYKFKCAGSLVSNIHVITAAHCIRQGKAKDVPKDDLILVLGKHNIYSWAIRSEIRNVKEMYVHRQYKQPSDGDIAIIVMSRTVEYTSTIRPICLWDESSELDMVVGSNGTVIGWGRDQFDNLYVPEPKQLMMPITSQEECLRADERFLKLTSNRTFCAGSRNGEAPCTGDSGGGFIMKRQGRWTLRGIVSSALVDPMTRTCDVNNFVVFADVSKFSKWIKDVMSQNN